MAKWAESGDVLDMSGMQQPVDHVEDKQRLHPIIGETFPGFGESDVAESARMTDKLRSSGLCTLAECCVQRCFWQARGSSEVLRSFFRAVVFDGVTGESRQVDRLWFGHNNNSVVIIICSVSGVGKTTIGQLLAQEL